MQQTNGRRLKLRIVTPAGFGGRLVLCVLAVLFVAAPAAGQPPTAAIGGQVFAENQPLAGATVELSLDGTVIRRVQTDGAGAFRFGSLAAGTYSVLVQHVGFRPSLRSEVRLAAGEGRSLRIEIEPAPVRLDSVSVVATPVTIDRRSTEFNTNISQQQIRMIPLGHDPASIVALTPGARADHVWGGATAQANNYQIDGLAANHPGMGGDLVQLSMTWIERVEVRGLGAGAEHGNFQGGLVNVVTKSGTNARSALFRTSFESHQLNSSNLAVTEIGSEVQSRREFEGEVSGPIARNRLFYYVAGQWVDRDEQFLNHLPGITSRYSPVVEGRQEGRFFGKLTWRPGDRNLFEASAVRQETRGENAGSTGYEMEGAAWRQRGSTALYNLQWQHNRSFGVVEAKIARIEADETRDPYGSTETPGVQTFGLLPPYVSFVNAPIRYRHSPASTTGTLSTTLRATVGGQEQLLRIGAEHSVGTHVDQRLRNGGMTWRPARRPSLDPGAPSTWLISPSYPRVPVTFGGEVDLAAAVENSAAFAQLSLGIGSRLTVNQGVRLGRWVGRLTPAGGGEEFEAVRDQAAEARIGAVLDVFGDNALVLKGHWGRYHQSMIAQFFDRVEGGNVFTNEEHWHYRGAIDPAVGISPADRDRLVDEGRLSFNRRIILNESGRVQDYRQPYVDQWLAGFEKTFGGAVKLEALYLDRRNRQMVSLVDLNAATNYTRFERVNVLSPDLQPVPFEGGRVQLRELYIPNNAVLHLLRLGARGECVDGCVLLPGLQFSDTLNLTWNPDYVLTNVPGARREFGQLQFTARVARPAWGGSASIVLTDLQGDLDNVTGYEDPEGYGAGPYVRVNEGVNAFGNLGNFSRREVKASVYGNLPWKLQGGVFWTWSSGDHYSPNFTLSANGSYVYRTQQGNNTVWHPLLADLEGHRIFLGPRGRPQVDERALVDLRLERTFTLRGIGDLLVTAELFNALNLSAVTKLNPSANRGRNFYYFLGPQREGLLATIDPAEYYRAVYERAPPRTLRIGSAIRL